MDEEVEVLSRLGPSRNLEVDCSPGDVELISARRCRSLGSLGVRAAQVWVARLRLSTCCESWKRPGG